jgi:hypothetical protein
MKSAWIVLPIATMIATAAVAQTASAGCATPDDRSANTLSDKLSESKGVICPPNGVDPKMAAPPPSGGNTPVIPPPGTPGGNQNVQPK